MTTTTMKIYDLQPTLDNPSLSRIHFPTWLKSLYNISQMKFTTSPSTKIGTFALKYVPGLSLASPPCTRQCLWRRSRLLQHQGCPIRIPTTRSCRSAPLVLFANFRDFCSSMTQNYEFLTACGYKSPNSHASIIFWPQFKPGPNLTRTSPRGAPTLLSTNVPLPLSNNTF